MVCVASLEKRLRVLYVRNVGRCVLGPSFLSCQHWPSCMTGRHSQERIRGGGNGNCAQLGHSAEREN